MEPTNNLNNNFSSDSSANLVPAGTQQGASFTKREPLTETPRVSFASMMEHQPSAPTSSASGVSSTSSSHSALDRLMNPTLSSSPSTKQVQSQAPASSTFKPYVPPAVSSAQNPAPSFSASRSENPSSLYNSKIPAQEPVQSSGSVTGSSRLGYSVGAPLSTNPIPQKSIPTTSSVGSMSSQSPASSSVFGVPPAPSASATSKALNQEIHSILNGQTQEVPKKSHKTAIYSIVAIILLGGVGYGVYYWYTNMYSGPKVTDMLSRYNIGDARQNERDSQTQNQANNSNSAFPAAVTNKAPAQTATKSATSTKPSSDTFASNPASTNTSKPVSTATKPSTRTTLITAPFNTEQRRLVSAYISTNINKITPVASRSSYVVDNVTFDGPQRAIVQYSDTRGSYSAVATASLDTSGTIKITSFIPLEK